MDHSSFKVIITGRYDKDFDPHSAAEKISTSSSIPPTQALKIIQAKQEFILHNQLEHRIAYQTKCELQKVGIEIKLEPSKLYHVAPPVEASTVKLQKKKFSLKKLWPFRRSKNEVPEPIKIDWHEQPRSRGIIHTTNKKNSTLGNLFYLGIFAAIFWFAYSSNFSLSGGADAYDEDGNPIIVLLVRNNCPGCVTVREQLKLRSAPVEIVNLDTISKDSEDYKKWHSVGKKGVPLLVSGDKKLLGGTQLDIATLLAENFGSKYFTTTEKPLYAKHFNADGSKAISIYVAPWCGASNKLKKQLTQANIPYNYTNIDNNIAAKKALGVCPRTENLLRKSWNWPVFHLILVK